MSLGCILVYPCTLAIQAGTFAEYIVQGMGVHFCHEDHIYAAKKLIAFSLMWLLLFVNFFSLRHTVARFNMAATVAKLCSTSIIIGTGLYYLLIKGK